ncbi:MAG: glutathione synthase [Gammaproteobacteria bacterium]|nr:glutathione synthase [Gammaproteobacteria bacterium]
MDPIEKIDINHDSSFAMILEAQERGWEVYYFQLHDLFYEKEIIWATAQSIKVQRLANNFFELGVVQKFKLSDFSVVLQRKDPPFNMEYIHTTYLLELAQQQGANIVNDPSSLRDCNEKMFTLQFPELCPPTLVSSHKTVLKKFWHEHQDIILKPLDGMGGHGIFRAQPNEANINSIIEVLTQNGTQYIMAQKYIPAIKTEGDKRIFIVNGVAMPYCLLRIPAEDDLRGNMVAGASINVLPLTAHEQTVCAKIGPILKNKGLLFVGLDVIGGFITEINVTSPTGVQEIQRGSAFDIIAKFIDCLAERFS